MLHGGGGPQTRVAGKDGSSWIENESDWDKEWVGLHELEDSEVVLSVAEDDLENFHEELDVDGHNNNSRWMQLAASKLIV